MAAVLAILWVLLSIVAIVGGFSLIIWLSNRVSAFIHRTPCPKCGCKEKVIVSTSKDDDTQKCKNCGHIF